MNRTRSIVFAFLLLGTFSCTDYKEELKEKGNEIIAEVEAFKIKEGRLPNSLSELGYEERLDGPLNYIKEDSLNYTVYFGTTVGEGVYYHSDTKQWDTSVK